MRQLQPKIGVTHLKIQALDRIKMRNLYAHEFWSTCSCSTFGSRASRNALSPSQQIQCGVEGQALWSSTAVDLHGICSINLAQWSSGYRGVFECEVRSTLSFGFSGTSGKIDSGRCQRETRLETLGRSCQKPDHPSQKALPRREFRTGLGERGLCTGLLDHRFDDVGVSVGQISLNKKRNQTAHAVGLKRTDSCLHLHFRRQRQRHKMVGRTDFRTWSHLHHAQGVYRLGKTFPDCELWGFFVIRAKDNLRFTRYNSQPVDKSTGLRSDQIGKLSILKSKGDFPTHLRRFRFYDEEKQKHLVFLTNNLQIPALTVAKLYKKRWEIELFFKWIKGNLEIKHYYGTSANAVKTQIWIAVSLYLIVAIIHKNLKLPGSLRNTLQILSVHPFDKTPLNELLMNISSQNDPERNFNQLEMFNL